MEGQVTLHSTGMFHWCPPVSLGDVTLVRLGHWDAHTHTRTNTLSHRHACVCVCPAPLQTRQSVSGLALQTRQSVSGLALQKHLVSCVFGARGSRLLLGLQAS